MRLARGEVGGGACLQRLPFKIKVPWKYKSRLHSINLVTPRSRCYHELLLLWSQNTSVWLLWLSLKWRPLCNFFHTRVNTYIQGRVAFGVTVWYSSTYMNTTPHARQKEMLLCGVSIQRHGMGDVPQRVKGSAAIFLCLSHKTPFVCS